MLVSNCVSSTLAPFQPSNQDWTEAHIAHLYRSIGYGADYQTIQSGLQMTPSVLVDMIIDQGANSAQPAPYFWSEYSNADYDAQYGEDSDDFEREHYYQLKEDWIRRGLEFPFQQKMTIFWHDHFATEAEVYGCNRYMWRYYQLIHQQAFGNFRTFVELMGANEAMLVYLNGNQNIVGQPNENYARELMELFTMGENNGYIQLDIEEVAKALTGYRVDMYECTEAYFREDLHDTSVKTIFGQSGNFGYDDVHELIFTLKKQEVATYICTKLYQFFIYREIDEHIIEGMAQTFIDNNWEIIPVLKQLLKSEHFFENVFRGAKIKSPVDLTTQMITAIGFDIDTELNSDIFNYLDYAHDQMGQNLFNPPDVSGWPGHRFWLSENALAFRWFHCHNIMNNYIENGGYEKLRQLAISVSPSNNDPTIIAEAVANHLLDITLDQDLITVATQYLKAGIPENYFMDGSWNLNWEEAPEQLLNMLRFIIQIPEFQLS